MINKNKTVWIKNKNNEYYKFKNNWRLKVNRSPGR